MSLTKKQRSRIFGLRYLLYDIVKWTGALSALVALRPKIIYENKKAKKIVRGAAVVIANHESYLDPIKIQISFWYRRMHLVATSVLFKTKLSRWFFKNVLCIEVNKDNFNFQTFREVSDRLGKGCVVGIFPEGGLKNNQEGSVSPFKAGAVIMALKNNAPIIPLYLSKPKHWYNRQIIVVGEPVRFNAEGKQFSLFEIEDIAKHLREKELKLIELIK